MAVKKEDGSRVVPVKPNTTETKDAVEYKHRASLNVYDADGNFIGIFNEAAQHVDEKVAHKQAEFLLAAIESCNEKQLQSLVFHENAKGNFELKYGNKTKGFVNLTSMGKNPTNIDGWTCLNVEFRLRSGAAESVEDKANWLLSE